MAEVFGKFACCFALVVVWPKSQLSFLRTSWAFHSHNSGLDVDLDALRDGQRLLGVDVLHLGRIGGGCRFQE